MKMQSTYGIYEDEIDSVVSLVRMHRPLAEIKDTPCPCCGAPLGVDFAADGKGFSIACNGKPLHLSTYQQIERPPAWWQECVNQPEEVTFYWKDTATFEADGSINLHVSGYSIDGTHWSGSAQIKPSDSDAALWRWIIKNSNRFDSLISDRDLPAIREDFVREQ